MTRNQYGFPIIPQASHDSPSEEERDAQAEAEAEANLILASEEEGEELYNYM